MTKSSQFSYFKTSPEIIRLAMMLSPLWLTIPAICVTRPHACAWMQTCLFCMRLCSCLPAGAAVARLRRYGGWVWGNVGCEAVATHLYARLNFKLNRAATLA